MILIRRGDKSLPLTDVYLDNLITLKFNFSVICTFFTLWYVFHFDFNFFNFSSICNEIIRISFN